MLIYKYTANWSLDLFNAWTSIDFHECEKKNLEMETFDRIMDRRILVEYEYYIAKDSSISYNHSNEMELVAKINNDEF